MIIILLRFDGGSTEEEHDIAHIASSISCPRLAGFFCVTFFPSSFTPLLRWLRTLTPVTYWCMLPGIIALAALHQRKSFWEKRHTPVR
ncbi:MULTISPECIES: hypothetical protein [Pantoea]|jgi:hypothetical protein|uniref:hypothetical protein n=1 Tax=unclassified Pantoea TaxID=2630326 RepID=UPI00055E9033|nr:MULTISPECIES: hypothetical protein [Pantoea]KAJ9432996.1 hypothetical protein PMI39_011870 [Pantoea sp. YR343]